MLTSRYVYNYELYLLIMLTARHIITKYIKYKRTRTLYNSGLLYFLYKDFLTIHIFLIMFFFKAQYSISILSFIKVNLTEIVLFFLYNGLE